MYRDLTWLTNEVITEACFQATKPRVSKTSSLLASTKYTQAVAKMVKRSHHLFKSPSTKSAARTADRSGEPSNKPSIGKPGVGHASLFEKP